MRRIIRIPAIGLLSAVALRAWAGPATEFWAAYSDDETNGSNYSIVVSNPDPARDALVVIEDASGIVATASVPAGQRRVFDPGSSRRVSRTALLPNAYRIRSDVAVHAQQFHDYDTSLTLTTGALLAPPDLFGTSYVALTMAEPRSPSVSRPSVVTIVAREAATVTVTASVATRADSIGAVPALNPGESATIELRPFDVLQVAGVVNADMTGTRVTSTAGIEVFAGCLNCHIGSSAAEDVEELQIPLSYWEPHVVAVSSNPATPDVNQWRILASEDGTMVTTNPVMPGMPVTLQAGRFVEFLAAGDFEVMGSAPVLVGRYNTTTPGRADPALCLMAPAGLFSRGGTFAFSNRLTSPPLAAWVDVVARPGTTVAVDGSPIAPGQFLPVGAGAYLRAQVMLDETDEFHRIEADCPVGLYAGLLGDPTIASFPVDLSAGGGPPPELGGAVPLLLAKAGSQILFSWADLGPGFTYNIYEGVLRSIWSHVPAACDAPGAAGVPGRRSETLTPSTSSRYYLMTASNCVAEGPSGADPILSICPP